jgi:hypothetical protein
MATLFNLLLEFDLLRRLFAFANLELTEKHGEVEVIYKNQIGHTCCNTHGLELGSLDGIALAAVGWVKEKQIGVRSLEVSHAPFLELVFA